MTNTEIIRFLKDDIEPLDKTIGRINYRCAAYLTDGTYLPCVIFQNPNPRIDQAIRRLEEERTGTSNFIQPEGTDGYREMVKLFTTRNNTVSEHDIDRVECSPYAIPKAMLFSIRGETRMGWTGFGARMKDGKTFAFGTRFHFEFFDMPEGYQATDIVEILSHHYMSTSGQLKSHLFPTAGWPEDYDAEAIHGERPFFHCYLEGL